LTKLRASPQELLAPVWHDAHGGGAGDAREVRGLEIRVGYG
jgi:hypothetical protein